MEARFALKAALAGHPPQSSSGRLAWEHRNEHDHILISTPLGFGIAEIEATPSHAVLRTADGQIRTADSADSLVEEAIGFNLPVRALSSWLTGHGTGNERITTDIYGRTSNLEQSEWQVEYLYEGSLPTELPTRININKGNTIELRLRIEQWNPLN